MRKRRILSLATALAVSLAGFGGAAVPARAADEDSMKGQLEQLEREEQELRRKAEETRKNLSEENKHKENLDSQIANIRQQLNLLDKQLDGLDADISGKNAGIEQKQKNIEEQEADLAGQKRKLEEKLRAVSKKGGANSLMLLLDADNYADYLIKSKAIERIVEKDEKEMAALEAAISALNEEKEELEAARQSAEAKKAETEALRKKTDGKKAELDNLYAEARQVIREMEKDKATLEANIRKNREEQEALDRKIAELNKAPSTAGDYKGGSMYWPVPTVHTMSRGYGMDGGELHKGLDIANHPTIKVYGQNIVAAADGVVLQAFTANTDGGGYGYHVIIDHGYDEQGRRITTLYAHCSQVLVKTGQKVTGGQTVIAKAGDTGRVSGPHLHFEVRVNNAAVDPIKNGYVKP